MLAIFLIIAVAAVTATHLHQYVTNTRVKNRLELVARTRDLYPTYTSEERSRALRQARGFAPVGGR